MYKKSPSLIEFIHEIKSIIKIMEAVKLLTGKNRKIGDLAFGGALILGWAHIEKYIASSLDESTKKINTKITKVKQLPEEIIGSILFKKINHDHLKDYYLRKDERKIVTNLATAHKQDAFSWIYNNDPQLLADYIIGKEGYPTVDNLKIVFFRFGIPDIVGQINKNIKGNCSLILESLNSLRCSYAHQAIGPNLEIDDIIIKFKEIQKIVRSLDRIIFNHSENIIKAAS